MFILITLSHFHTPTCPIFTHPSSHLYTPHTLILVLLRDYPSFYLKDFGITHFVNTFHMEDKIAIKQYIIFQISFLILNRQIVSAILNFVNQQIISEYTSQIFMQRPLKPPSYKNSYENSAKLLIFKFSNIFADRHTDPPS